MFSNKNVLYYSLSLLSVTALFAGLRFAYGIFGGTLISLFSMTQNSIFEIIKIFFWPVMVWMISDRFFFRFGSFEKHTLYLCISLFFVFTALNLYAGITGALSIAINLFICLAGFLLFFILSYLFDSKIQIVSIVGSVISICVCIVFITLFCSLSLSNPGTGIFAPISH